MEILYRAFRRYIDLNKLKALPKIRNNTMVHNSVQRVFYRYNALYEEDLTIKGNSNVLSVIGGKNVVVVRRITVKHSSDFSLNINIKNNGWIILFDEIILEENSSAGYKLYGKIGGEVYHYINVVHSRNSKSNIDIKAVVLKKLISIGILEHPVGSRRSYGKLNQLVIAKPESKIVLLPGIKVLDPDARAVHGAKKVILTKDQEFYLRSKGLSSNTILDILEKSIIYMI